MCTESVEGAIFRIPAMNRRVEEYELEECGLSDGKEPIS